MFFWRSCILVGHVKKQGAVRQATGDNTMRGVATEAKYIYIHTHSECVILTALPWQ